MAPEVRDDIVAIKSKFSGMCTRCGSLFPSGRMISWDKRLKRAYHWSCTDAAMRQQALRRGTGKSVKTISGGLPSLGNRR